MVDRFGLQGDVRGHRGDGGTAGQRQGALTLAFVGVALLQIASDGLIVASLRLVRAVGDAVLKHA